MHSALFHFDISRLFCKYFIYRRFSCREIIFVGSSAHRGNPRSLRRTESRGGEKLSAPAFSSACAARAGPAKVLRRRHTIFSIRYQPKKSKHSFLRAGSFPAAAHPGKAPRSRRFSPASGRPTVCRRLLFNMGVFHGKSGKNPAKMFFENGAKFCWTNGFSPGRFRQLVQNMKEKFGRFHNLLLLFSVKMLSDLSTPFS